MKFKFLPLCALAIGACDGGSLDQGIDKYDNTGTTNGDGSGDGTTGADGGGDGSGDDGSGDGGSGDGGSGDGTGDDGGPTVCTNAWLPVDKTGWSKTYAVTFDGASGTGTETGQGLLASHPKSSLGEVYGVSVLIETSSWTYNVIESIGCDTEGEGMYLYDYAGDWGFSIIGFPLTGTVTASLSPYRRFLPPEYAVGASGNWNYSYTTTLETVMDSGSGGGGGPTTSSLAYEGTFAEAGVSSMVLQTGETVMAYKLVNTYIREGQPPFGAPMPASGYIEQWYVKGLGLVKEVNIDDAKPDPILTKELVSYSGLSIIE